MSFFEHRGGERPAYDPPTRVYARVDEVSTLRRDGWTLFDAVDADWLDAQGEAALVDPDGIEGAERRVSLVEVKRPTGRREEGRIAEITFGPDDTNGPARQYLSLSSPPIARQVDSMSWVGRPARARIGAAGSIAHLPDATPGEIARALALARPAEAVAVYDVGQGACNALIVGDRPAIYFDMGCGSDANRGSYPANLTGMCFCAEPTVVLSHFHHDHWALVARHREALAQRWIVPRQAQSIGFIHSVLVGLVRQHGSLLVYPASEEVIVARNGGRRSVSVHRCLGSSRNDSGLAMVVYGPGCRDGSERMVLLPGDARYGRIALCPDPVTSLVAAHHGGVTNAAPGEIPGPDGQPAGRLVYSYGDPNTYGHPRANVTSQHAQLWEDPYLATANRTRRGLGHVHLYWSQRSRQVRPPCRAHACLGPVQR